MASSAMRCWISEPRTFRVETSGPGAPPSAMVESARSSLISSACTCRSMSAIFSANDGIVACHCVAQRSRTTPRLDDGTSAMPSRSLASRNLAQVQPSFSLPIRLATGTFTLSRNTSFTCMGAVEHDDRPHGDARRLHVDQQEGDAFLRLGFGVGAHQAEDPVAPVGVARSRSSGRSRCSGRPRAPRVVRRLARSEPAPGSE